MLLLIFYDVHNVNCAIVHTFEHFIPTLLTVDKMLSWVGGRGGNIAIAVFSNKGLEMLLFDIYYRHQWFQMLQV